MAAGLLVAVWLGAWGAFRLAANARVTPEKVEARAARLALGRLSAADRERALKELAGMINRLAWEDRRRLRLERKTDGVFQQMTDAEKVRFIESTLPTGFRQMLSSFEQMPEAQRRRAVTNSLNRLKEARDGALPPGEALGRPPALSPEIQQRILATGLKTFYEQSSPQAKAELAPLLEEMQKAMESGRFFRGPRPEGRPHD